MAQDIYTPLHGKRVAIDKLSGPFRSCAACGGVSATIDTMPVGMHHGQLYCEGCGQHTAFLSRDHLAAMIAAHNADEAA